MFKNNRRSRIQSSRRSEESVKSIFLVAGVRPDFIKLAPLYSALCCRPDSYKPIIIHTGQHYDECMSDIFFEQLHLPKPDAYLGVGSGTHGLQTGKILIEIERMMLEQKPDMVVVFGDANSTLAAAVAAAKLGVPVSHVEAGHRSKDPGMPEEINRAITDRVSTLLFTSCEDANINLLREGASEDSIHFVGSILIDSLCRFVPDADDLSILGDLDVEPGRYTLVTVHRPCNADDGDQLRKVVSIVEGLASLAPVIFPIHPRTRNHLLHLEMDEGINRMSGNPRIHLAEPFGYLEFLKLMKDAAAVVTDSSGIQEETTYLGVPCLTVLENTERPATISDGTNILIGLRPERVVAFARECLDGSPPERKRPLLWDGKAAERIVDNLDRFFGAIGVREQTGTDAIADIEIAKTHL